MTRAATEKKRRVRFQTQADPGSDVYVAGTFNDWSPKQKKMKNSSEDDTYSTSVMLPKGRHEYKFIVDGEWHIDTSSSACAPNDMGTLNSVVIVD